MKWKNSANAILIVTREIYIPEYLTNTLKVLEEISCFFE